MKTSCVAKIDYTKLEGLYIRFEIRGSHRRGVVIMMCLLVLMYFSWTILYWLVQEEERILSMSRDVWSLKLVNKRLPSFWVVWAWNNYIGGKIIDYANVQWSGQATNLFCLKEKKRPKKSRWIVHWNARFQISPSSHLAWLMFQVLVLWKWHWTHCAPVCPHSTASGWLVWLQFISPDPIGGNCTTTGTW